jgi:quinoprotein dehydrogenase-associated probable ABC transporter substrate-binding protein
MSSRFPELRTALATLTFACACAGAGAAHAADPVHELRVCADPDNLPYSQRDESGFENRIARLIADDLGMRLSYFWQEQRRGFVRKSMGAGVCDLFIGVPAGFDKVLTTRPYYRSTYVAVTRGGAPDFSGFAPGALRGRRFGVQLIGNDMAASPPGYALAKGGALANVTGFLVYGDGPAARRMADALASGAIDVALAWGPQAAYFAHSARVPMKVAQLAPPAGSSVPFAYSISIGVRKGDTALRDRLDALLVRRKTDIDAILDAYFVPRVALAAPDATAQGGQP